MLFTAATAFAQGARSLADVTQKTPALNTFVQKVMSVIVIPVMEGLFLFTFLIFVWGVIGMIRHGDDAEARDDGKRHILWGTAGMAIMVSAYGLVRLISNTVGGIEI